MPQRLLRLLGSLFGLAVLVIAYGYQTHTLGWNSPTTATNELGVPSESTSTNIVSTDSVDSTAQTTSTVETNATVIRAVDGDTLEVRLDGEEDDVRVRLLGINTPETVDPRRPVECFGKEASSFMHQLVDGKRIRLESDPQADERDKYNRLLRNVFLADGTDVNALMVEKGYAFAYLSFPLNKQRKQQLKKLQEDAKLLRRGLWSPQTCNGVK